MSRPVVANIDLKALQHNLARVRQLAPASHVMSIVKADAYGHSLLTSCLALEESDAFGLLDLADAISLRNAGFSQPICLLEGFFTADEIPAIASYNLEPVIHSGWQLDILQDIQDEFMLSVWLKVDTGMHRLGFATDEFRQAQIRLSEMKCIHKVTVMSHLASADERSRPTTAEQLQQFVKTTEDSGCARSLSNSAAILAHPDCHYEWVRPGIMLYGSSPFSDIPAEELDLSPVMSLQSEIISVKHLQQGDAVGYGGTWLCPEEMRIAVVACGYGDGYPRHAPAGTPVMVAGTLTTLIGRVSMDMVTVDLRGIDDADIGSPVELWGKGVSVDKVAEMSGTIAYELLCGVTARVKRQEVSNG